MVTTPFPMNAKCECHLFYQACAMLFIHKGISLGLALAISSPQMPWNVRYFRFCLGCKVQALEKEDLDIGTDLNGSNKPIVFPPVIETVKEAVFRPQPTIGLA